MLFGQHTFLPASGKNKVFCEATPPPGERAPHVGQQGLNPVVCSTKGRAASEPQGFAQWRCVCTVTGYSRDDRPSGLGT